MSNLKNNINEEVDLLDVFRIFIKRKKFFFITFFILIGLSLIYSIFIYQPQNKYSSYIKLAGYYKSGSFILPASVENVLPVMKSVVLDPVVQKMSQYYPGLDFSSVKLDYPKLSDLQLTKIPNIIEISLIGQDKYKQQYKQFFTDFIQALHTLESTDFHNLKSVLQYRIQVIQKQLSYNKIAKDKWLQAVQQSQKALLSTDKDPYILNAVLLNAIQQVNMLAQQQMHLKENLRNYQFYLKSIQPSHFMTSKGFVVEKIGFEKKRILFLLFIGAFLGTMFLTIVLEFVLKFKK